MIYTLYISLQYIIYNTNLCYTDMKRIQFQYTNIEITYPNYTQIYRYQYNRLNRIFNYYIH